MSASARELLHRYLRQRRELGEAEVILDGLSGDEFRALVGSTSAPSATQDTRAVQPAAPARAAASDRGAPARERGEAPAGHAAAAPAAPPARPATAPMRPAVDAPALGIGADVIRMLPTLDAVRDAALGCPRCRLAETRQHVVFGEGSPDADVLVVGEAPGADEDRSGRPFVGKAGRLLDLMLASVGMPRDQVYICNVLKCRPPSNRNPQPDEVEACSPYLLRQVELVRPRVIIAFGNFAAQTLLGTDAGIGKLRVSPATHRYHDVPVIATYHPAALLRNPGWVRAVWDDLQRARRLLAS